MEHDRQCIPGRQAAPAGLIEAECVEGDALDHEDDDLYDHSFGQIRRLAVDDEGVVGKDEDDQGDARFPVLLNMKALRHDSSMAAS